MYEDYTCAYNGKNECPINEKAVNVEYWDIRKYQVRHRVTRPLSHELDRVIIREPAYRKRDGRYERGNTEITPRE